VCVWGGTGIRIGPGRRRYSARRSLISLRRVRHGMPTAAACRAYLAIPGIHSSSESGVAPGGERGAHTCLEKALAGRGGAPATMHPPDCGTQLTPSSQAQRLISPSSPSHVLSHTSLARVAVGALGRPRLGGGRDAVVPNEGRRLVMRPGKVRNGGGPTRWGALWQESRVGGPSKQQALLDPAAAGACFAVPDNPRPARLLAPPPPPHRSSL
jgi:hypothetical protein